jgi:transposase
LCVLLIAEGHRPNQVAEWLGEHTRTLERWRKRYVDNGLDGLIDETSPGRPPKLSSEEWKRLRVELGQPPATYGLEGKKWQGKLLQNHLTSHYGIDFSLRQCQRLLKQYRQRPADTTYKTNSARDYISNVGRVGTE